MSNDANATPAGATLSALSASAGEAYTEVRRRKHRRNREEVIKQAEEDEQSDAIEPPPLPVKRPLYPGEPARGTPAADMAKAQPPSKPAAPMGPPPPPESWTAAQIDSARKECERLLPVTDYAFKYADPIKEGACGLASPISLSGFQTERAPTIELKPAAIISCTMSAALRRWVEEVLQPKAKARLDATIIRITNASAYVCRTRYDDPTQRMSQHAYGNAFDISEFITAKGEVINVLDHWNAGDERAAFLREIHSGACEIFGTTLGPEANEAHKNHFHFDIAERRQKICDFSSNQQARKREAEAQAALNKSAEPTPKPSTPQTKPAAEPKKRSRD